MAIVLRVNRPGELLEPHTEDESQVWVLAKIIDHSHGTVEVDAAVVEQTTEALGTLELCREFYNAQERLGNIEAEFFRRFDCSPEEFIAGMRELLREA